MTSLGYYRGYCVPDLEFYWFATHMDYFGTELDTYCCVMVEFELFLEELKKDATFTNTYLRYKCTRVTYYDELE